MKEWCSLANVNVTLKAKLVKVICDFLYIVFMNVKQQDFMSAYGFLFKFSNFVSCEPAKLTLFLQRQKILNYFPFLLF